MPYKVKVPNIILLGLLCFLLPAGMYAQGLENLSAIRTVVIDPGHGGKDPGAISRNGKFKEKNITLSVAQKLGKLINGKYPEIKVIYTRSTDKYVELAQRAEIANRNKADLFISIHVNSAKSVQARGTETFVMGAHKSEDNFEVCKLENSVIVIEDDYEAKYEGFNPNSPESYIIFSLLQNTHLEQSIKYAGFVQSQFAKGPIMVNRGVKQGGLLVLWRTTMPAVLTELGFISNSKDYAVLVSQNGQQQFAQKLFNAFVSYKENFESAARGVVMENGEKKAGMVAGKQDNSGEGVQDKVVSVGEKTVGKKEEAAVKETVSRTDDFYAIQILSVDKVLKTGAYDLKGRKDARYVKVGKAYKYYLGRYETRKEATAALENVRKTFPGAFVIHLKDNEIIK